jgi:hypothetical protein
MPIEKYMPRIHVKFTLGEKRFGVKHKGRLRGINRNLVLYQYDGKEWNHLEEETQKEATGSSAGRLTDLQLENWGQDRAAWYV